MTRVRYPTTTDAERESAIEAASIALQRGELVVLPTDTVYGIAADAFSADAVSDLLAAKGRGREMPPPVLIASAATLDALARDVPPWVRELVAEFWPGPLTIVLHQQSSLLWDLGETRGTVAVRMPDDELTRAVLERTGPLAVSSANTTGEPAATDADRAEAMLGDRVAVIIDAGESRGGEASTIVDATGPEGRILRHGALSITRLNDVLVPLGTSLLDSAPDSAAPGTGEPDRLAKQPHQPAASPEAPAPPAPAAAPDPLTDPLSDPLSDPLAGPGDPGDPDEG